MQKILAISGGIDSVVMLHMMRHEPNVVVAHFNHGIRDDSDQDEIFVANLAKSYGLAFISQKANLSADCSEAKARDHRYALLSKIAVDRNGEIYTAHHKNDLIESIAINILRGTGWRGLVPLDAPTIHRPLIYLTKTDIYQYAAQHNLTFRHDSTNTSDTYLRNRLRHQLRNLSPDQMSKLSALHDHQGQLKSEIDHIIHTLLPPDNLFTRRWFTQIDDGVAIELLRAALAKVGRTATRPQLAGFLQAIRTYKTNKKFNLGDDYLVLIGRTTFKID